MIDRVRVVWEVLDFWERWTLVMLAVAAVGQVLFVAKYLTRRWFAYRVGRALMGKSASLAAVLVLTVIGYFYAFPEPVWAGVTTAIAVFIVYQTHVLWTSPLYVEPVLEDLRRQAETIGYRLVPTEEALP
jgi:hypothetical protein